MSWIKIETEYGPELLVHAESGVILVGRDSPRGWRVEGAVSVAKAAAIRLVGSAEGGLMGEVTDDPEDGH